MSELFRMNSFAKLMAYLSGILSLALMGYGLMNEAYWAGFGLVLLTTSVLVIIGISFQEEQLRNTSHHRSVKAA